MFVFFISFIISRLFLFSYFHFISLLHWTISFGNRIQYLTLYFQYLKMPRTEQACNRNLLNKYLVYRSTLLILLLKPLNWEVLHMLWTFARNHKNIIMNIIVECYQTNKANILNWRCYYSYVMDRSLEFLNSILQILFL